MSDTLNHNAEQATPTPYQALIERAAYFDAAKILENYQQWRNGERPTFLATFALGSQAEIMAHQLFTTEVGVPDYPQPDEHVTTTDAVTLMVEWHGATPEQAAYAVTYFSALSV